MSEGSSKHIPAKGQLGVWGCEIKAGVMNKGDVARGE